MNTLVKDVMTTQVIWVEQDTPFAAIAAALRQYWVSAFPVLNDAGEVIGVVSIRDLVTADMHIHHSDAHVGSDFP